MAENLIVNHAKKTITVADYAKLDPAEVKEITILGNIGYTVKQKRKNSASTAKKTEWYQERLSEEQFEEFMKLKESNENKGFFAAVAYVRNLAAQEMYSKDYNELKDEKGKPDTAAREAVNAFIKNSKCKEIKKENK